MNSTTPGFVATERAQKWKEVLQYCLHKHRDNLKKKKKKALCPYSPEAQTLLRINKTGGAENNDGGSFLSQSSIFPGGPDIRTWANWTQLDWQEFRIWRDSQLGVRREPDEFALLNAADTRATVSVRRHYALNQPLPPHMKLRAQMTTRQLEEKRMRMRLKDEHHAFARAKASFFTVYEEVWGRQMKMTKASNELKAIDHNWGKKIRGYNATLDKFGLGGTQQARSGRKNSTLNSAQPHPNVVPYFRKHNRCVHKGLWNPNLATSSSLPSKPPLSSSSTSRPSSTLDGLRDPRSPRKRAAAGRKGRGEAESAGKLSLRYRCVTTQKKRRDTLFVDADQVELRQAYDALLKESKESTFNINKQLFRHICNKQGQLREDKHVFVDRLFAACHGENSAVVEFNDMVLVMGIFIHGSTEDKAHFCFEMLDFTDDGKIDAHDVYMAYRLGLDKIFPNDFVITCEALYRALNPAPPTVSSNLAAKFAAVAATPPSQCDPSAEPQLSQTDQFPMPSDAAGFVTAQALNSQDSKHSNPMYISSARSFKSNRRVLAKQPSWTNHGATNPFAETPLRGAVGDKEPIVGISKEQFIELHSERASMDITNWAGGMFMPLFAERGYVSRQAIRKGKKSSKKGLAAPSIPAVVRPTTVSSEASANAPPPDVNNRLDEMLEKNLQDSSFVSKQEQLSFKELLHTMQTSPKYLPKGKFRRLLTSHLMPDGGGNDQQSSVEEKIIDIFMLIFRNKKQEHLVNVHACAKSMSLYINQGTAKAVELLFTLVDLDKDGLVGPKDILGASEMLSAVMKEDVGVLTQLLSDKMEANQLKRRKLRASQEDTSMDMLTLAEVQKAFKETPRMMRVFEVKVEEEQAKEEEARRLQAQQEELDKELERELVRARKERAGEEGVGDEQGEHGPGHTSTSEDCLNPPADVRDNVFLTGDNAGELEGAAAAVESRASPNNKTSTSPRGTKSAALPEQEANATPPVTAGLLKNNSHLFESDSDDSDQLEGVSGM